MRWEILLDGLSGVSNVLVNKLVGFLNLSDREDAYLSHAHPFCLCLFVQQVNGSFRPSSTGSIWGNLLQLCSLSLKIITTEEPTCLKENVDVAIVPSVSLLCNN